jgi:YebC/PmpR family DNA-binding regulatory protein
MAKTSDQKAKVYSKYSKEIYMCAKNGSCEVDSNPTLGAIIDRAKKEQVPAHVIEKALDKARGGGGENYEYARYEGYGPGNSMVIVECLTDNPNRTFGDVRVCFTKTNSKIGTQGSVAHMFDHAAIFVFSGDDDEAVLEALLMADVDVSDVESEDGKITVFAPQVEYGAVRNALQEAFPGIEFDVDEIQFVPHMTKILEGEDLEMFEKFIALLEDVDDVQNIYYDVAL